MINNNNNNNNNPRRCTQWSQFTRCLIRKSLDVPKSMVIVVLIIMNACSVYSYFVDNVDFSILNKNTYLYIIHLYQYQCVYIADIIYDCIVVVILSYRCVTSLRCIAQHAAEGRHFLHSLTLSGECLPRPGRLTRTSSMYSKMVHRKWSR